MDDDDNKALEHLAKLHQRYPKSFERLLKLESENPTAFEGMIRLWNAVAGVTFLGGGLLRILVFVAAIIGAWVTVQGHFIDWITRMIK